MSKCLLTLCAAAIVSITAANDAAAHGTTPSLFKHYFNDKYGYEVDYPKYLTPQGEADAGDGQKFESKSKPLAMKVWGFWSAWSGDDYTIDQEYKWEMEHLASNDLPNPKVLSKRIGKNWFEIKGTSKGQGFSQRTVKGKDVFATVFFTYPQGASGEPFEADMSHIRQSLKPPR